MKALLLALLLGVSLHAQSLSFYFDPSDGMAPVSSLQPLPSTYSFPDTSVGQTASVLVRLVNASSAVVTVNALYVGAAAGSSGANSNFSLTGFPVSPILVPGAWEEFYLNFSPTAAGPASAYLQMSIAGQSPVAVSTLSGNGLSSVGLTCIDSNLSLCDGITPIPSNSTLTFGATTGVALGSSYSIPFTLTNNTSTAIPTPSVANATDTPQAFTSTRLASLPPTIAPGSTVDFNIVFTPQALTTGSSSAQTASLTVGSASYTLQGSALSSTPTPSFYLDPSDGLDPISSLKALSSTLTFPNTAVGQISTVTARVVNPSATATLQINALYVGTAAGSSVADSNFSITGLENATLAPQGAREFQINFTPTAASAASGYLQVSIAGQPPAPVSMLSGTGLPPPFTLTCSDPILTQLCNGTTPIPPTTVLTFGPQTGVALDSSHNITFTLTNNTSAAVPTPTPKIANEVYTSPSFTSPDIAALPATIPANAAVSFNIVFTPQAIALGPSTAQTANLTVGSAQYNLQGYEQATTLNDPPRISCVYTVAAGQACASPASNTYSLGPDSGSLTAHFTIENHNDTTQTSNAITITAGPAVSNPAFTIGNATLLPLATGNSCSTTPGTVVIPAGCELAFDVTFTGSTALTGSTLSVSYSEPFLPNGTLKYTLNGQPMPIAGSTQSGLPGLTLMCGTTPCSTQTFTSEQQVTAFLQVTSTSTTLPFVSLLATFTPSVTGITQDAAVGFITPDACSTASSTPCNIGPLSFTPDSATGTASTPPFTFQTGTTAGTITITTTDQGVSSQPYTVSIPVLDSKLQITSSTAVRKSPNLIVTITGYDNTYSAGPLSFTFYDVNGTNITPNAIQVDATSAFHQYFFSPGNTAGGAFSLQVTFPVTGDVTQIGSVTANVTNSAGQASVTQTFQ